MTERSSPPLLDRARCTGCGDCIPVCAPGVLALVDGRIEFVKPDSCDYCGECEAICSQDAISCPYDVVLDVNGQSERPWPEG